jgi:aldose 1-epimerase
VDSDPVVLADGTLRAVFAPDAGMVCCSLTDCGVELLTQRDGLAAYAQRGTTMGIPLLYPWANRLSGWSYEACGRSVTLDGAPVKAEADSGLPIHGVLPRPWRVVERDARSLAAELEADDGFRAAYPFPHTVRLEAALAGRALTISVTVEALDAPVPVSFGFHPYVTLPGVAREEYEVELPAMRRLELDERKLPVAAGAAGAGPGALAGARSPAFSGRLGSRGFDDGFDEVPDGAAFAVSGGGRRVEVRFATGFPCAQVFAPPEKQLICFEPMTAPADALRAGAFPVATPGEPFHAAFSVAV